MALRGTLVRIALVVVALVDGGLGVKAILEGQGTTDFGSYQENVGVMIIGAIISGVGGLLVLLAVLLLWLGLRKTLKLRLATAALLVGIVLGGVVGFVWWDARDREIVRLTPVCSNLDGGDPAKEVAVNFTYYAYFPLMNPGWHKDEVRYTVEGRGERLEFRLRCVPRGPCVVEDGSEAELRAAVKRLLPVCPPPPP